MATPERDDERKRRQSCSGGNPLLSPSCCPTKALQVAYAELISEEREENGYGDRAARPAVPERTESRARRNRGRRRRLHEHRRRLRASVAVQPALVPVSAPRGGSLVGGERVTLFAMRGLIIAMLAVVAGAGGCAHTGTGLR